MQKGKSKRASLSLCLGRHLPFSSASVLEDLVEDALDFVILVDLVHFVMGQADELVAGSWQV